jgi:hypothetical protein
MNQFKQLCVWPGTLLGESTPQEFEQYFLDEMGVRVKYHTEVKTLPDLDSYGRRVPDTGDRNDLFFFVHNEDTVKFAVPRLQMGIRWWEDVVKYNDNRHLYTEEFLEANPTTW